MGEKRVDSEALYKQGLSRLYARMYEDGRATRGDAKLLLNKTVCGLRRLYHYMIGIS